MLQRLRPWNRLPNRYADRSGGVAATSGIGRHFARYGGPIVWGVLLSMTLGATVASALGPLACMTLSGYNLYYNWQSEPRLYAAQQTSGNSGCYGANSVVDGAHGVSIACQQTDVYPVFVTQGAKGNITTDGNTWLPGMPTPTSFIYAYLVNQEKVSSCLNPIGDCHVQFGWRIGLWQDCNGGQNQYDTSPTVFVEIFDDTRAWCYTHSYATTAPSIASYDARYYGTVQDYPYTCQPPSCNTAVTMYRYNAYYQDASSGIQLMAYGNYRDQYSMEAAGLEILPPGQDQYGNAGTCPRVSSASSSAVFGQAGGSGLFASQLQLYRGSWVNWDTAQTDVPTTFYQSYSGTASYYASPVNQYTKFNVGGGW